MGVKDQNQQASYPARRNPRRVFRVRDPRGLDDTGRLLFAARVMLAMEDVKRFGGMSSNELKQALRHIHGAENLTINYAPGTGNLLVTIADRTVEVHPTASNAEIGAAFNNPAVPTANTTVSVAAPPAPINTAATLPAPRMAPITQVSTPKMSITGAVNAGMTIKDIIANSRKTVQAAHDKLKANAGRVNDAAAALDGLGSDLGAEADDLMAMIGQFKNDLTPSTPVAPAVAPTPPATPLPAAPALIPNAPAATPA